VAVSQLRCHYVTVKVLVMVNDWQPERYLAFAAERAKPALDLIARIPGGGVTGIADLGCGPGNSTLLLQRAFPKATIAGYDSSPAMIAKAKAACAGANFQESDISQWRPGPELDLVFSNALFQWVPNHAAVLARIFGNMKRGGVLAIQMPDNLGEPSHRLMAEIAADGPWAEKLQNAVPARSPLLTASGYHDLLSDNTSKIDVWRTTYHHLLEGHQGIIDMLSTTGLKPFIDPLSEDERLVFLERYKSALKRHYASAKDGKVLYPFPRLFIVAVSAGS
jgi:trans-aconitate 2-methyltransferase